MAKKAISMIEDDSVVGLGASSTMPWLVDELAASVGRGLKLRLVTSSFITQQLLNEKGLFADAISGHGSLDIYFDGCDQFDRQLNAVKSGGGIHTREKLLAAMAKEFVLLGDRSKYTDTFDTKFPLVTEILPEACRYVLEKIPGVFPGSRTALRISDKKIGPAVTDNGNYLADTWFTQWPEAVHINTDIKKISGVVETSFFYQLAHFALLADGEEITVLRKTTP